VIEALRKTFLQGHSGHMEYTLMARDGKRTDAEFKRRPHEGQVRQATGFIMIVKDITERKRARKRYSSATGNWLPSTRC